MVEIGPVAGIKFGMEELAIGADLECAAARGNQGERFDALAEFEDLGRQTDGLRRVVSDDAVFDRYFGFHRELLSDSNVTGLGKHGQDMHPSAATAAEGQHAPMKRCPRQRSASRLERKVQSAADHREIILRAVDDAPAQIVGPTDVAGEANLKPEAQMPEHLSVTVEMMAARINGGKFVRQTGNRLSLDRIAFAAAEDRAAAGPGVRGKAAATDRITQGDCAEHCAHGAFLVDVAANENAPERLQIDKKAALVRVEHKTFKAEADVAAEEILDVAATAPGVVVAEVAIEGTADGMTFGRALNEIGNVKIGIVIGVGEDVGAPEIRVPFRIAVEFRAGRRRDGLLHF